MRSIALALLVALAVAPVAPGAATSPTEQLKASTDQMLQILDDPAFKPEARLAERRKAIRRIANEIFDFDVSAEGVSLVANYRTQFNSVIRTSSYDQLVKRMRSRIEEFRAPQR